MARARVDLAAPWRWLQQSAALLRAHPRALAGGASLLVAVALLPSVAVQLLAGALSTGAAQGVGMALWLLLYPPAVGGFFRLLHARASGVEAPPGTLFAIFADGPALRRLVIANLVVVSLALLVIVVLASLLGGEALVEFMSQLSKLQPGATTLPPLPAGALSFALALMLFGVLMVAVQDLVNAELALGSRQPLAAIAAAAGAAWRNYGALLLFFLPASLMAFLAFMLVAMAAMLVGALLAVASAALAQVLMLVAGLLSVIVLYALLFGFFYFAWRELFDESAAPPAPDAHQIAA